MTNLLKRGKLIAMNYKWRFLIYLILLIITLVIAAYTLFVPKTSENGSQGYISLSNCFTRQINMPYYPDIQVLGIEIDKTLYKIIECESNFNPDACNVKYGCGSGRGLCQFIKSTWLKTIERMGDLLPEHCRNMEAVFDGECNLIACKWLFETDGDIHWRAYSGECYL